MVGFVGLTVGLALTHDVLLASDCASYQTSYHKVSAVGFNQGTCPRLRDHHGATAVHSDRIPCLVPVCFGVPDEDAVQPGLQQRPADLAHSRRAQERPGNTEQGVSIGSIVWLAPPECKLWLLFQLCWTSIM